MNLPPPLKLVEVRQLLRKRLVLLLEAFEGAEEVLHFVLEQCGLVRDQGVDQVFVLGPPLQLLATTLLRRPEALIPRKKIEERGVLRIFDVGVFSLECLDRAFGGRFSEGYLNLLRAYRISVFANSALALAVFLGF